MDGDTVAQRGVGDLLSIHIHLRKDQYKAIHHTNTAYNTSFSMDFSQFNGAEQATMTRLIEKKQVSIPNQFRM